MIRSNINIDDVLKRVRDAATAANNDALQVVFDASQQACPVRTGDLKGSGHIEGSRIVYGNEDALGYAAEQELEKAFMRNALKTQKSKALEKYSNRLK